MDSWFALGKNISIALISLLFLLFGIQSLIASYRLNNPLEFIMFFFSSCLIILISLVGIIYPAFRIKKLFTPDKMDENVK